MRRVVDASGAVTQGIPDYDVLVTNPPYSGDNMERLLRFCSRSRKPFMLLLPNYVYTKEYFEEIVEKDAFLNSRNMFYIAPLQRYLYTTPNVMC